MNTPKINNPITQTTVNALTQMVKNKEYDKAYTLFSYRNGGYAAFYATALLSRLNKEEIQGWKKYLQTICDPNEKS